MSGKKCRLLGALASIVLASSALPAAPNALPASPAADAAPIKVACVGDSITQGAGTGGHPYPEQLQRLLGAGWTVRNFGVSGATLMQSGNLPYRQQDAFRAALAFNPDVVVILLGTNDTKPQNWKKFPTDFETDLTAMVGEFAALPGKPRIFVCSPPYIARNGNYGINESNTLAEIPVIARAAKARQLGVIDVHGCLQGKDELIPDNVHPNQAGAGLIAAAVFKALTGQDAPALK